jgi:hypothetical protein
MGRPLKLLAGGPIKPYPLFLDGDRPLTFKGGVHEHSLRRSWRGLNQMCERPAIRDAGKPKATREFLQGAFPRGQQQSKSPPGVGVNRALPSSIPTSRESRLREPDEKRVSNRKREITLLGALIPSWRGLDPVVPPVAQDRPSARSSSLSSRSGFLDVTELRRDRPHRHPLGSVGLQEFVRVP